MIWKFADFLLQVLKSEIMTPALMVLRVNMQVSSGIFVQRRSVVLFSAIVIFMPQLALADKVSDSKTTVAIADSNKTM